MPEILFPVTLKVKKEIESCVADGKELFWHRRKDTLELRVVTYTYENGNFRSRKLWIYEPITNDDIDEAKRLHNAILSLYPERTRHSALNDLKPILNSMWFDGVISKVPFHEFKTLDN